MLLSDRDIRAELAEGRVVLEPFDEAMIQPSSVDVRMDKFFRVFENHRYPHIDPAEEQPELTREVEPLPGEPFILHPGEFVLASTYEVVTLPDDIAGRLEGKSSLGRLGILSVEDQLLSAEWARQASFVAGVSGIPLPRRRPAAKAELAREET